MKIKHSKFKNTGLIYELLVKQITSDLVSRKDSPAVDILRKYYSGSSYLLQEYKLYKTLLESKNVTSFRANALMDASLQACQNLDEKKLLDLKYGLVSEIKKCYDLENFFSIPVKDYRTLAAIYCLFESYRSKVVDPETIMLNKVTVLENMSYVPATSSAEEDLIQEYSTYDRDLRLLTFKVLVEKYNEKYKGLLEEQKEVLKNVLALESVKELRNYVNSRYLEIGTLLLEYQNRIGGIEKIKIQEARKMLSLIPNTEKVTDTHLVRLLQFYDLLSELKNAYDSSRV